MIPTVTLTTPHLELLPLGSEDYEYLMDVHDQSRKVVYDDVDSFDDRDQYRAYVQALLASNAAGWVVLHRATANRLGVIYLTDILEGQLANLHPVADIRMLKVVQPTNGDGQKLRVMDEAAKAVIRYAFDTLKLQRVGGAYGRQQVPAIQLCERLGFQHEGAIRRAVKRQGKPVDLIMLGLLPEEVRWL